MAHIDAENTRVLVTGASGYLAAHVIKKLQQEGYQVRGTVRSVKNEEKLKSIRQLCPDAKHPIELVEAELQDPSPWKAAVQGCKYVMHLASPFPAENPAHEDEVIKPAVAGVTNVLQACAEAGGVKRVVLTSSVAAVSSGYLKGGHYDESNWSDPDECQPYEKSKTLAEKAAWDFMKENSSFELAVINPAYVMGPVLSSAFATSMVIPKQLLQRETPVLPRLNFTVIDVRDVAAAHLRAMVLPEAAGQRHVCSGDNVWLSEMAQIYAQEFDPQGYNVPTHNAPKAAVCFMGIFDKSAKMIVPMIGKVTTFTTTRMKEVLGVNPLPLKDTLIDMGYSMIERGMVKKTSKYHGPGDRESTW